MTSLTSRLTFVVVSGILKRKRKGGRMMTRKIREGFSESKENGTTVQPQQQASRVVRAMSVKDRRVDRLYLLQQEYDTNKAAFKRDNEAIEKEIADLKEQLMAHAKEKQVKQIEGSNAVVRIEKSSSSAIDGKKLLHFLRETGRASTFWRFVSVKITECKDFLGKKVLESEGIMETKTDEYGRLKVMKKS